MSLIGREVLDMTFTLASGQTLTGHQVVKLKDDVTRADAMEIEVCTDASERPLGIAQVDEGSTVSAGEQVTVRLLGVSKAIAGAAFDPRDTVSPGGNGLVAAATTTDNYYYLGWALTKTSQAFDEMLVFVFPEQYNT